MTKKNELYKCEICSNIAEITHEGEGTLVCCGQDMKLANFIEAPLENAHHANIEIIDDITKRIYFNHEATLEHHIEFIEVISNDGKFLKRKFLDETEPPEIILKCDCKGFYVRLYCNRDGFLMSK